MNAQISDPYANEPLDAADERVLLDLAALHEALDPMPTHLIDEVKFRLTVQALDAEIAQWQRAGSLELVRSVEYTRTETMTFTAGEFSAMVTVEDLGETVRIDGWLTGGEATVELRERARSRTVEVGEAGRFVFDGVSHGLVQLVIRSQAHGRPVITPSFDV